MCRREGELVEQELGAGSRKEDGKTRGI